MANLRDKKFTYNTVVKWQDGKKGTASSSGKPDIQVATPPEFRGHPGMWSPEDLFVVSVNSCIMTTFLHFVEKEKIELVSYEGEAEGTLERTEGKFMFSLIRISLKICVKAGTNIDRVREIVSLSEKGCLISNSIKSKVEVIPNIEGV